MLDFSKRKEIKDIRSNLYILGYDIYYMRTSGMYNYYFNPWQTYEVILQKLPKCPKTGQLLIKLLLLGDELNEKEAAQYLGEKFITALVNVGFLNKDNGSIQSNGYSIVAYRDRYFVTSIPYDYPNCTGTQDVYIGWDSYKLTDILPYRRINERLDLCSGSGIQCIMNAEYAKECIVVEKNEKVIPVLKFNTVLNDLEDKIKVVQSDLYQQVEPKKFDLITANPPFIPVPDEFDFPIAGAGGEDGLKIVLRILEEADNRLNPQGEIIIIGEAIGGDEGTLLYRKVCKMFSTGYSGEIFLQNKCSKSEYINRLAEFYVQKLSKDKQSNYQQIVERWNAGFEKYNADYVYSFMLRIRRTGEQISCIKEIFNYDEPIQIQKPKVIGNYDYMPLEQSYYLMANGKIIATLNNQLKACLELCDGTKNIDEIMDCANIPDTSRKPVENTFKAVCNELIKNNIMIDFRRNENEKN